MSHASSLEPYEGANEEKEMSSSELCEKYLEAGEHPKFTMNVYNHNLEAGTADLNYWDWVYEQVLFS